MPLAPPGRWDVPAPAPPPQPRFAIACSVGSLEPGAGAQSCAPLRWYAPSARARGHQRLHRSRQEAKGWAGSAGPGHARPRPSPPRAPSPPGAQDSRRSAPSALGTPAGLRRSPPPGPRLLPAASGSRGAGAGSGEWGRAGRGRQRRRPARRGGRGQGEGLPARGRGGASGRAAEPSELAPEPAPPPARTSAPAAPPPPARGCRMRAGARLPRRRQLQQPQQPRRRPPLLWPMNADPPPPPWVWMVPGAAGLLRLGPGVAPPPLLLAAAQPAAAPLLPGLPCWPAPGEPLLPLLPLPSAPDHAAVHHYPLLHGQVTTQPARSAAPLPPAPGRGPPGQGAVAPARAPPPRGLRLPDPRDAAWQPGMATKFQLDVPFCLGAVSLLSPGSLGGAV